MDEKGENAEHDGGGEKLAGSDQVKDEWWVERGLPGDCGSAILIHDELRGIAGKYDRSWIDILRLYII